MAPCSRGMSRETSALRESDPSPGMENMDSVMTAPPKRDADCIASRFTTGGSAFFSAWRRTMRGRLSPFMFAVRMKSAPMASSMLERTRRTTEPAPYHPRTNEGRTRCSGRKNPETGNHLSL